MRNEKRNVSDPFGNVVVGTGVGDRVMGGAGDLDRMRKCPAGESRRWRDGDRGYQAASDNAWRRSA